ncbi:hypothetical protein E4U40_002933 [Claviceps sp. LM458 group G5]|nr:hypothetical protein E4U40_002933 [Claviceps sp. LM458 group G5]
MFGGSRRRQSPAQGNGKSKCRDRSSSGVHESPRLHLVFVFGRCRCRSQGTANDTDERRRGTVKESQQEELVCQYLQRECERSSPTHQNPQCGPDDGANFPYTLTGSQSGSKGACAAYPRDAQC